MLPSSDQLFKDADLILQQDLAPAHTAKSNLTRPEPQSESMGYCPEENAKQETKKCR